MQETIAVILGGGKGTRLWPLTELRAKPAVPLAGKYRLIDVPLSNCINSGLRRIFVLTQFNSKSLNIHVSQTYQFDMFQRGFVAVLAAEQTTHSTDWFQGTADAVRQHMQHFEPEQFQQYLILSGDQLYHMDYRTLLHTHYRKRADVTIATLPVTREQATSFGIMKVDDEGRIVRFVEKPNHPRQLETLRCEKEQLHRLGLPDKEGEYLASMGIYVVKREVMRDLLLGNPTMTDFGRDIIPLAIRQHRVFAHCHQGYWEDIGTIRSFFEANLQCCMRNPPFNFFSEQNPVYTRARMLPVARMHECHVQDCMIAEGAQIVRAHLTRCVIGIRSIIDRGVQMRNVVMMGADWFESATARRGNRREGIPPVGIGHGSVIENAIVDKNARIGPGCRLTNEQGKERDEGQGWAIRDGIIVIGKDAVIPAGTVI